MSQELEREDPLGWVRRVNEIKERVEGAIVNDLLQLNIFH